MNPDVNEKVLDGNFDTAVQRGYAAIDPKVSTNWDTVVLELLKRSRQGGKKGVVPALPEAPALKYVVYAYDKHGNLSMGKGRGRLKLRMNPNRRDIQKATGEFFQFALHNLFVKQAEKLKAEGGDKKDIQPVDGIALATAAEWAAKQAVRHVGNRLRAEKRAAGERQRASRRVNYGMVPGNADRRAHAAV